MKYLARPLAALLLLAFSVCQVARAAESNRFDDLIQDLSDMGEKKEEFGLDASGHLAYTGRDFLGTGLSLSGNAKYSDGEKLVKAGVRKEDLFAPRYFGGLNLWGWWQDEPRYRLKAFGRDVYFGRHLTNRTSLTLKFTNSDIEVYHIDSEDADIAGIQGANHVSFLSAVLDRSATDNKRYPRKGSRQQAAWEWSGRPLGSEFAFTRLTASSTFYFTPGKKLTYVSRSRIGWIGGEVPLFERFFLGGADSVRGYEYRMLGPKDGEDLPLGGRFMAAQNFEARRPVYKGLYAAAFFDAGGLWQRPSDFRLKDIRFGTGAGLRYVTKWGTARLDYGIRLGHDDRLGRSRIYCGFGMSF